MRDLHTSGVITLIYIPTGEQLADALTKPVNQQIWDYFTTNLGLKFIDPNPNKKICKNKGYSK